MFELGISSVTQHNSGHAVAGFACFCAVWSQPSGERYATAACDEHRSAVRALSLDELRSYARQCMLWHAIALAAAVRCAVVVR